MKRALLIIPMLAMASSAYAASLTVTNHIGLPIDELFASPAGKAEMKTNMKAMKALVISTAMKAEVFNLSHVSVARIFRDIENERRVA